MLNAHGMLLVRAGVEYTTTVSRNCWPVSNGFHIQVGDKVVYVNNCGNSVEDAKIYV